MGVPGDAVAMNIGLAGREGRNLEAGRGNSVRGIGAVQSDVIPLSEMQIAVGLRNDDWVFVGPRVVRFRGSGSHLQRVARAGGEPAPLPA